MIANMTHEGSITALTFSPDGNYLATASQDNTARVWRVSDGREVTRIAHEKEVLAIAFNPDGDSIATVSSDNTAAVWKAIAGPEIASIAGEYGPIADMKFSPDGLYLSTASEDKTVAIWEAATGRIARIPSEGNAHSVALSPDGKIMATAIGEAAQVWDVISKRKIENMKHEPPIDLENYREKIGPRRNLELEIDRMEREGSVEVVAFSPDGKYLVTTRVDDIARVWEVAGSREVWHTKYVGFSRSAFSPDGKFLALADGDTVQILEMISKKVTDMKYEHPVDALVFSPDGRCLITTSKEERDTGGSYLGRDKFVRVREINSKREVASMDHNPGLGEDVIVISLDGRYLVNVSTEHPEHTVNIWELNSGQKVAAIEHKDTVNSIGFSPD